MGRSYWRFRYIEPDELRSRFDDEQLTRFYVAWMERGLALQREVRPCAGHSCGTAVAHAAVAVA